VRRLFQSFDRHGVRYLLISGQASVLYGAADFSEDVDVWIDPSARNVARFLRALAGLDATVYSGLTPPMTRRNVDRGHGFHFIVPDEGEPLYLDVMPRPPRVGSFAAAYRRRRVMESSFGRVDVVSVEDLVELKKTRRLSDYDVITNLVARRVREEAVPSRALLEWAARNAFRAAEREIDLKRLGRPKSRAKCQTELMRDITRLQRRDLAHWSRVIEDLRRLRDRGALLEEGERVRDLVGAGRKRHGTDRSASG
jgi:hypothetical protein